MGRSRRRGAGVLGVAALVTGLLACSGGTTRRGSARAARDPCGGREAHVLDGVAQDAYLHGQVTSERLHGLHRRYRLNYLAAASDGGFVIAGGGSHLITDLEGCPRTERAMDVVSVDDDFEVRWRWIFPQHVSPASIAGDGQGGAVLTFLTHEAAALGQLQIAERAVGVMRIDGAGRLDWARVLATGYQRLPHYIDVERGGQGLIAVAMEDQVVLDEQQDGTGRPGLRVRVLSADGEHHRELLRPWQRVAGLAWTGPGRLVLIGDRAGNIDPQMQPLISEPPGQQAEGDGEPPRSIGIAELVAPDESESLWQRQWGRASPRWEAKPTVAPGGAIAFVDLMSMDRTLPPEAGRSHHRLIVLDEGDGSLQWSYLMAEDCGYLHVVAADPRNGDFVVGRTRRCTGRYHAGTSVVVERLAPDGEVRWAEVLGEPRTEGRSSAFHLGSIAVSQSGRTALIGHGRFMDVAGVSMTTDFEHFALVFEP